MTANKNKPPLLQADGKNLVPYAVFSLVLMLAVSIYIAGVMTMNPIMTGIGLIMISADVIVSVVVFMLNKKREDIDLDEEARDFERDLKSTLEGYEIDCDNSVISVETAEYVKELEKDKHLDDSEEGNGLPGSFKMMLPQRKRSSDMKPTKTRARRVRRDRQVDTGRGSLLK